MIRKSLAANNPGSDVAEAIIQVIEEGRSARLSDRSEDMLQGYQRRDKNVDIRLEELINPNQDENTNFFWIVQRQYVVYERDKVCNDDRICFRAYKREKSRSRNVPTNQYELDLRIDELTAEILDDPVVLIKESPNPNGSGSIFKTMFVSR